MEKILVTGAAGFIGSHLCEHLVREGFDVIGIDNLSKGSLSNLQKISSNHKFTFVEGDVTDLKFMRDATSGCSAVYHLADDSDIQYANDHPQSYFLGNIGGLYSVLSAMELNNIDKIFYPSSTTVFGAKIQAPIQEGAGPLRPESLYGASKAAAEAFLHAWSFNKKISVVIFRFAAIIGGRQDHGVVHDFVKRLCEDKRALQVLGSGEQLRSFVLVDDCVEIAVRYFRDFPGEQFSIVHLANPDLVAIKDVASLVRDELGLPDAKIQFERKLLGWSGDSKTNELDVETLRAAALLPKISSRDAVIEAAKRLKKQYEGNGKS